VNIAGGSLTDNQSTNTTFAGSIVGNGSLTKSGSGRLNVTGANTYAGPTTITGGTLSVNGSITSPVTVASGGTLGGTGTVGTTTIQSGGTYAPGNSIGTQTVAGNVTFAAGSVFQVEANAAGQADRVNATGTATLQGGTVQVLAATGTYNNLTNYTVLTAAGGVNGQFAGTTSNLAFLTPFLSYSGTAVTLTLARNDVSFGAVGANRNQTAVGTAITGLGVNNAVYRALLPMSATGAQAALGQLSGEIYATETAVLADSGRRFREAVLDRGSVAGDGIGLWATGVGDRADSRNEGATAPVSTQRYGTVGGVDFGMGGLRIGLDGGYMHDRIRVPTLGGASNVDTTSAGAHVAYLAGPVLVQAGGTYEWHDVDTTRSLAAASLGSVSSANHGRTIQGFGEIAYQEAMGQVSVTPFARFSYVDTRLNGVTETGNAGALTVATDTHHYEFGTVGVRLTGEAPVATGVTFLPRMSLAYTHGWNLQNLRAASFTGTSSAFSVAGTPLGRDTLDVKGGFDLAFGRRVTLGVAGFGSTSRQWSDYGGQGTVSVRF
ncbi:MAG: autotransporter outer membrane beta-barrel domain-containing protein, partial [Janthinobacterium lividum]